jgi:TRAP-type C4-dicarboxylate transport system permease small subunit
MAEPDETAARPTDAVGRALFAACRVFALFGGLVLCAMAVLTTTSVTGRFFFNSPILGDFELIAIGTGVAVFAFLPYCQLTRENVLVDFFLSAAPIRLKSFFDTVGNLIYGTIITIMTWRLSLGGIDLYRDDQMTMVLEIPRWWTFPAALACLVLLLAVCIYTTVRSVSEIRLNRPL